MRSIWKYQILPTTTLTMPVGAKVLCVNEQRGEICLWAEVDPNAATEKRTFSVYLTKRNMQDDIGQYIGTAFIDGMDFHIYEMLSQ